MAYVLLSCHLGECVTFLGVPVGFEVDRVYMILSFVYRFGAADILLLEFSASILAQSSTSQSPTHVNHVRNVVAFLIEQLRSLNLRRLLWNAFLQSVRQGH
jgi:hypothetical protein